MQFFRNRGVAEHESAARSGAGGRVVADFYLPRFFTVVDAMCQELVFRADEIRAAENGESVCFSLLPGGCIILAVYVFKLTVSVQHGYGSPDVVAFIIFELNVQGTTPRALSEGQHDERCFGNAVHFHPCVLRDIHPTALKIRNYNLVPYPWKLLTVFSVLMGSYIFVHVGYGCGCDKQAAYECGDANQIKNTDSFEKTFLLSLFFFLHAPILYRKMRTCNKKRLHSAKNQ